MTARPVLFYAPMKPPDHPVPSGDRRIARLTLEALRRAGFAPRLTSTLRVFDGTGDAALQATLFAAAGDEAARILRDGSGERPAAWVTYHSHYKAPDLLGPAVSAALGIPYVVTEPSTAPARRDGPWAAFAAASDRALAAADRLLWTTPRDRPGLVEAGWGAKLVRLPAFVETGPPLPRPEAGDALRLLAVAMMRPGDKLESYRLLAAALPLLAAPWRLTVLGDGPARGSVERLFAPLADRVAFGGPVDDPARVRTAFGAADLLAWPGIGEGVGMVWLEAQEAGCPVAAVDGPASRDLVRGGVLSAPDPAAYAGAIARAAAASATLSVAGRRHVETRHSLDSAARTLGAALAALCGTGA